MGMRNRVGAAVVIAQLGCCAVALADSDCGMNRPLNAGEKSFYAQRAKAFALLPPAPPGWSAQETSADQLAPPAETCADLDPRTDPLRDSAHRRYERQLSEAEGQKRFAQVQELQDDPARKAAIEKADAKAAKLLDEMAKAGERQDLAGMQRISAEYERAAEERRKLDEGVRGKQDELFTRDSIANVSIDLNVDSQSCWGKRKALSVPGAIAWLCQIGWNEGPTPDDQSSGEGRFNSTAVVLFGNWKTETQDEALMFTAALSPQKSYSAVQSIAVVVSAEARRAEALLGAMKLDSVRALLTK